MFVLMIWMNHFLLLTSNYSHADDNFTEDDFGVDQEHITRTLSFH